MISNIGGKIANKVLSIIVAPHYDDELIGCYSVLRANYNDHKCIILYLSDDVKIGKECLKLPSLFPNVTDQQVVTKANLPRRIRGLIKTGCKVYFPDPYFETHPFHKSVGNLGVEFKNFYSGVIFYSTNMLAPYIFELSSPSDKKQALDNIYKSQRDLWKYDHKYFLFEGYCQWLTEKVV